ncbi:putative NOP5 family protein [uncultured archaeon]|nr:putative NOP5 family protein [uncultured archaeon]
MIYVSFCPLGVFAADASGKEVARVLFEHGNAAKNLRSCMSIAVSDSEKKLISQIKSDKIVFEQKKEGYEHEFPNPAGEYLRRNTESIAAKTGFASKEKFLEFVSSIALQRSSEKMIESFSSDKLVIQAVNAVDELDKVLNTLSIRLREWYGFYFPELGQKIQDNEQFVNYVAEELYRKDAKGIQVCESIGSDVDKKDLEEMQRLAKSLQAMYSERKSIEGYIDARMKEIMPNTTAIIGSVIAARLLSIAGSLEKLAKFPSSTIQILGAETALFRHLVSGGRSPKYGILFQTNYVQQAPFERKGKMARLLASKLSMAIKIDFYKGNPVGAEYKKALDAELAKMKKGR